MLEHHFWDPDVLPRLEAYVRATGGGSADLAGLCPAFVLVGQNDPLRDEAVHYSWRLLRTGVSTELHVLPGLPHAFDLIAPDADPTRTAYDLMNRAVRRAAERT